MRHRADRLLIAVAGLVVIAAAARLAAQDAAQPQPLRIAVIDTERVLLSSRAGKEALAELQALRERKEGEGRAKQQEIQDLQRRIAEGRTTLAQDALAALEKQAEEQVIALRRFQEDATAELGKRRDEVLAAVDRRVMPAINQAGAEEGYTLIFRKFESGLIYADPRVDITDRIIARIDAPEGATP
jgi:outer membrane protein